MDGERMEEGGDMEMKKKKKKKKKKNKILVHTVKWDVGRFSYGEFYTIDLENGQVSELPHVLLADAGLNSMVDLGSAIYIVGGQRMECLPCTKKPPNSKCIKKGLYHKGVSYYLTKLKLKSNDDSDDGDCDWKEAPCPEPFISCCPSVVAFGGKIYLFHTGGESDSAGVFDPASNKWDTLLPPPQVGFFDALHTTSAVADPDNDRILVHFYGCNSLFAYYPHNPNPNPNPNPRWELVMTPANWSAKQIFVDGIIIFDYLPEDPDLVNVFHLPTQQDLNVVFTKELPMEVWRYEFDNIISLGDGVFALVAYSSFSFDYRPPRTEVYLAKFSFHLPADRPADILITPLLPVETFTLNTLCEVRNYLLI